jgi:4,5-dihydroxyphthalate decarboxylase
MSKLELTLACWDYDRTRPLMDGRVQPEGIDLRVEFLRPREMFPRMLERQEFHMSELSLASYASLIGRGECPFVALPVAVSKLFRHSCIYVRTDAGIATPQDLKGKRVGTTQYGSTAVVYIKGMLQDDFGVRPADMHWFVGGMNAPTEAPLIPMKLPETVKVEFLPEGATLAAMFEAGGLDALFSIYLPPMFKEGSPRIARLFPNYKEAEKEYYRRTRIFPIMHTVVVRRDVLDEYPWVARSMFEAFCAARDLAVDGLHDTDALRLSLPWLIEHVEEAWQVFGTDFWAYGLEPNRPTLEALGRYVHEQGLSPRRVHADEIFCANLI